MYLINLKGKLLKIDKPIVMAVVNLTDDSFYTGSRFSNDSILLKQIEKHLIEGASVIDLGGYSSRPGAVDIEPQLEIKRVIPALEVILKNFPQAIISIDTFRSEVADKALSSGAAMINDITAGLADDSMIETVAKYRVPFVMMHMRGTPQTMKTMTVYNDLIPEILMYLNNRTEACLRAGIKDIIWDPGFGFAKTIDQNFHMLKNLSDFTHFGYPLLAGISRKSMIWKTLNINANEALNGTTALHMVCLQQGAKILRVHDVKPAMETISLFVKLQQAEQD